MKVEIQNDEHITVQYYPAHYGHTHLPASDEPPHSENSMTMGGMNGSAPSPMINGHAHHHHHQQQHQPENGHHTLSHYPSHSGDCSSSSSPGSASTSPSGGSNSNSNHPPTSSMVPSNERPAMLTSATSTPVRTNVNMSNNHPQHQHHSLQNQLSHCIIISPSFMVDEGVSSYSNHHATPVLVVQQQVNHHLPPPPLPSSSPAVPSSTTAAATTTASATTAVKKEKCVSDIMREAFQLLSYWPLDHHHGLITAENEPQIHHSHVNMDEHLMF